jgi:hypothetical protein
LTLELGRPFFLPNVGEELSEHSVHPLLVVAVGLVDIEGEIAFLL